MSLECECPWVSFSEDANSIVGTEERNIPAEAIVLITEMLLTSVRPLVRYEDLTAPLSTFSDVRYDLSCESLLDFWYQETVS